MAVEYLDELLSQRLREDFQLLKEATPSIKAYAEAIIASNKRIADLENDRADSVKKLKDNIKGLDEETKLQLKLGLELQYQQSAQAKQEALLRQQIIDTKNANREYAKSVSETTDAYKKLDIEHKKLVGQARQIGAIYGATSKEFKEAAASANEYGNRLREIDAGLGMHQRNVGNYKSVFSGLGSSIQQVARELPNFALSFQTGMSALTNNLPILAEEISNVRKQNAELISQGKPTVSVFKQILTSVLSWQTALVVGITVVTAYSKEIGDWAKSLVNGKGSIDKMEESISLLNKALSSNDYQEAIKNVDELTTNISLAKEGLLDKKDVLEHYNETIGKTTGEVSSLDQAESQLVKNAPAYIQMTLAKATAQLAMQEAAKATFEAAKEQLDFETRQRSLAASNSRDGDPTGAGYLLGRGLANEKAAAKRAADSRIATLRQIAEEQQREAAEIAKKGGFDFFPNKEATARQKKNQDDYKKLVEEFQLAIKEFGQKSRKGLPTDFDFVEEINRIAKSKGFDFEIEIIAKVKEDAIGKELLQLDSFLNNELAGIHDRQLRGGFKSHEDYQKAITDVTRKYAIERTKLELNNIESIIEMLPRESAEWEKFYNKLSKLQAKLGELQVGKPEKKDNRSSKARMRENLEEWQKDLAEFLQSISQIINAAQQLQAELSGLVNDIYQRRIDKLDEERDKIKENQDAEIESINKQALTQEEKERRIQIAKAKTDAEDRRLQAMQRQAQIKQAKFNRVSNISDAISKGALAVLEALATLPPPYSWIVAGISSAIATAQVARVLATPLPSYAEGTLNHKGGKALIGEGGQKELVQEPSGKTWIADRPMIVDLPKRTRVFNEDQLAQIGMRYMIPKVGKAINGSKDDLQRLEDITASGFKTLNRTLARKNMSVTVKNYGTDKYKSKHTKHAA